MNSPEIELRLSNLASSHSFYEADFNFQIYSYLAVLGRPADARDIADFLGRVYRGLNPDELLERIKINLKANSEQQQLSLFSFENERWRINNRALLESEIVEDQISNLTAHNAQLINEIRPIAALPIDHFVDFSQIVSEITTIIDSYPGFSKTTRAILRRVWNPPQHEFLTLQKIGDELGLTRERIRQQIGPGRKRLKKIIFLDWSDTRCPKLCNELLNIREKAGSASIFWNVAAFEKFLFEYFGGPDQPFFKGKQSFVELFELLGFVRLTRKQCPAPNQIWLAPGSNFPLNQQIENAVDELRSQLKKNLVMSLNEIETKLKQTFQFNLPRDNMRFLPTLLLPLKCVYSDEYKAIAIADKSILEKFGKQKKRQEIVCQARESIKKLLKYLKKPVKSVEIHRFLREHEAFTHLSLADTRKILAGSLEFAAVGLTGYWCLKNHHQEIVRPKSKSDF